MNPTEFLPDVVRLLQFIELAHELPPSDAYRKEGLRERVEELVKLGQLDARVYPLDGRDRFGHPALDGTVRKLRGLLEENPRTGLATIFADALAVAEGAKKLVNVVPWGPQTAGADSGSPRPRLYVLTDAGKGALAELRMNPPKPPVVPATVETKPLHGATEETTKPSNRGKNVNARMLDKMQKDPTCHGWTAKQWAQYLKCSEPSVVATETWKLLQHARELHRAERAKDRRQRKRKA